MTGPFSLAKLKYADVYVYFRTDTQINVVQYNNASAGNMLSDEFLGFSYATFKKFFEFYEVIDEM